MTIGRTADVYLLHAISAKEGAELQRKARRDLFSPIVEKFNDGFGFLRGPVGLDEQGVSGLLTPLPFKLDLLFFCEKLTDQSNKFFWNALMTINDQVLKTGEAPCSSLVQQPQSKTSAILNAAERIFGNYGYAGASMREISTEAGVAQALLHYHYGSKENLYTAVFERRSTAINIHRNALLDQLFVVNPSANVEDVLTIAFTPLSAIFHGEDAENLAPYLQMVSAITLGNDALSKHIREQFYDPIARRIIDTLHKVVPGLSHDHAVWAYLFSVGARQQAHLLNERAGCLGASPHFAESKAHYSQLVRFAAAGIRALVQSQVDDDVLPKKRGSTKISVPALKKAEKLKANTSEKIRTGKT